MSDEIVRLQPEIAVHLSKVYNTLEKQGTTVESKLGELQYLLNSLANGQFQISIAGPVTATFVGSNTAFTGSNTALTSFDAVPSELPLRPPQTTTSQAQLEQEAGAKGSIGVGKAPEYRLMNAKTVADVWREWELGIAGGPAVKDLERVWGHRWRPVGGPRVAFSRRKVILDELARLRAQGHSPDDAVAELEAIRGSRSIRGLWELLTARNKE